jgi:hypothetical protein
MEGTLSSQSINQKTCLLTGTSSGDYNVTGTGQYAKLSGKGTLKGAVTAILTRSGGKCKNGSFTTFQEIIHGSGPVTM